jgi:hypothetical protein
MDEEGNQHSSQGAAPARPSFLEARIRSYRPATSGASTRTGDGSGIETSVEEGNGARAALAALKRSLATRAASSVMRELEDGRSLVKRKLAERRSGGQSCEGAVSSPAGLLQAAARCVQAPLGYMVDELLDDMVGRAL